jgi:DNA replication protein DnaC
MVREQTFEKLYKLQLHGMAQALEQQIQQPESAALGFEERLAMLVDAQWLWRENRAIASRLRRAHLKQLASIEDINYRHQRQLDRAQMKTLATCDWIRQHHNVTISGAAGLGKTYICNALLDKACREGFSALYVTASKFFRQLSVAYADGSFDQLLAKLSRIDVLAIDDWGLTLLSDMERRHLLEVLDDRNECRSTIVASQFEVGVWHNLVGNPTLGDSIMERILTHHHEIVLRGETIRQLKRIDTHDATPDKGPARPQLPSAEREVRV